MRRELTLRALVRAVGGDLYDGGRRANIPAPGHGPHDRSVSLLLSEDRLIIHCFAGDDWRQVRRDLAGRGLVDTEGRLTTAIDGLSPRVERIGRADRVAAARRLWEEAGPIAARTASAAYLRRRRAPFGADADLRHHAAAPSAVYAGRGPRGPALLAAIRSPDGALQGVEIRYLTAEGAAAPRRLARKTVGACPGGSAVRLSPAGPRLLVGEGVATCLSAAAVFGLPSWALLGTRNLRAWRPPPEVRAVLIAADRGAAGEEAARALAAALRTGGVAAAVRWPPIPFGDWNEAVVAGREEEGGQDGAAGAHGGSGAPRRRPAP